MIEKLIFAFIVFLPAGVANMTPIFAAHVSFLKKFNQPIDGKSKFRNKRIFGDHKTWRGLITGVITGSLTSIALGFGPVYGILVSLGALGGDAAKSFFKRQANVPSGHSWFPFDQIDFIVGGLLLALCLRNSNPAQGFELWILAVYFISHLLASFVGFLLKLKDKPI